MAATRQTTTVTVELEPEDIQILRKLAGKRGLTLTRALQRAIRQSERLDEFESTGRTLILEDADKTLKTLRLD
jgi:predicted transcriptional regulator